MFRFVRVRPIDPRLVSRVLFSPDSAGMKHLFSSSSICSTLLSHSKPQRPRPRQRVFLRGFFYTLPILVGGIYIYDRNYNYSVYTRTIRAAATISGIFIDNKLNGDRDGDDERTHALRDRTSVRLYNLFLANGGIYMKFGQAIALNSGSMPLEFRARFSRFFDNAPTASMHEIEAVLREEFDIKDPAIDVFDSIFLPGSFQPKAVGSASIAQVHRAQLKSTGEPVAVKIQKPAIKKQISWDLWAFRQITKVTARNAPEVFGAMTQFISERLLSETDFVNELENSECTRKFINSIPEMRDVVYIPKTYPSLCTKRVLVAEWIDGTSIAQKSVLTGPWKGEEYVGRPIEPDSTTRSPEDANPPKVFGLGLQESDIMKSVFNLFCAQIFLSERVHCDPHPGNILVRRRPDGRPQLVLLDHGLYVKTKPEFRQQYARLWRGIATLDKSAISQVASEWGIGMPETFGRMTAMKRSQDFHGGGEKNDKSVSEEDEVNKRRGPPNMDEFFKDPDKFPKVIWFLFRIMRTLTGTNELFGSPVNELRIIGDWAGATLAKNPHEQLHRSLLSRLADTVTHLRFLVITWCMYYMQWGIRLRERWRHLGESKQQKTSGEPVSAESKP